MSAKKLSLDFHYLFKFAPGAILVLMPDWTIAEVTEEYLRLVMKKRENTVGRNIFETFPDNPEDETPRSEQVRASFLKVFATGEPDELPVQKYDIERPAEAGGGFEEHYWRLIQYPCFDENGKVAYLYQRVENITAQMRLEKKNLEQEKLNVELVSRAEKSEIKRKETAEALEDAQMRLEAALDAGQIGTWTWNPVSNSVVADKNLTKFFSISEEDAGGGKIENYLAAIHPDDAANVGKLITDALENSDTYEAEYRLINPDGAVRWVIARGKILRDEKGSPQQLPGVVIDITDIKKDAGTSARTHEAGDFDSDIGIALNRREDLRKSSEILHRCAGQTSRCGVCAYLDSSIKAKKCSNCKPVRASTRT